MEDCRQLEIFYDYICPWCYLGTLNSDRLRSEYGIEMRYTLFPLHPEIPEEGMELGELFPGRPLEAMKGRLREAAAAAGVRIAPRSRISNSRKAQELEKWAVSLGKGEAFRELAFRTYFADGRDIGRIDVLEEVAAGAGLDSRLVETVIVAEYFAHEVDADWQRSAQLGVSSIPFYLYGDKQLVGYRPYEDLLHLVGRG